VLVPARALPSAKSRLTDASRDDEAHARLVRAIRADTIAAAAATAGVRQVIAVVDAPGIVDGPCFIQAEPGLNPALTQAGRWAARNWPDDGLAVLMGDLPALRPAELQQVLSAAARHPRAFVADAAGTGTSLLCVLPPMPLTPAFGPGSAARHGLDAVSIDAGPGLRLDVDTADDLRTALEFGVGAATRAVLAVESGLLTAFAL
jgi:2-phospho-L-lactate guanylyltransferase